MFYNHSLEKTVEYFRMTVKFLGRYNLPYDPANYTVGYEYSSNSNPHLLTDIEKTLSNSQPITPELSHSWFQEHVAYRGPALIQSIKKDLSNILEEIFGDLSETEDELSGFKKSLLHFSNRIEKAKDRISCSG